MKKNQIGVVALALVSALSLGAVGCSGSKSSAASDAASGAKTEAPAASEPAPKAEEKTEEKPAETTPAAEAPAQTSSSSEVREALDACESFMNEYCDFMEDYKAQGSPVSMMGKYGEMMTNYADMMKKFDAIDEGSLSPEDDAYYIDVQARVSKRLLEVAQ